MRLRKGWPALLLALLMVIAACGDDEGAETTAAPATTAPPTATTEPGPPEILTDVGVDDDTIKIGLLADLTGIFSGLVVDIVDAQKVYFDKLNEAGGIAGRQVELVIEDTGYDVPTHVEKYNEMRDEVVAISQSTGSPHTAAIREMMEEDNMVAIPLTWYSGWGDAEIGRLVLEQGTNYCLEAMNVIQWISDKHEEETGAKPTLGIATFPGEYGQDGATGAKLAADALGLEVAYDGEGAVIPGQDQTPVIQAIAAAGPDWVFTTVSPAILAEIVGGSAVAGYQGRWTGSGPSYSFRLLDSPVAQLLDATYFGSSYYTTWGADAPGMPALMEAMTEAFPERLPSDVFVRGWIEGIIMTEILEAAAANGDMTRAGVVEAALSIGKIDLQGLAPDQTYAGSPNDYVVRESLIFKPNLAEFTAGGGVSGTMAGGGNTGVDVLEDSYVSPLAADYDFQEACFTP